MMYKAPSTYANQTSTKPLGSIYNHPQGEGDICLVKHSCHGETKKK